MKNLGDLVSVVIPVYNVEQCLRRCIESVCEQSYKKIEIILVDDGSSDNSLKICYEYANKDNRVFVIHKTNGGVSESRNVGIKYAHGKYIMFVDSDDYIHKDMIKELYEKIISDMSDMVICGYSVVDENNKEKRGVKYVENNDVIENEKEYWTKAYDSASFFYIVVWNKLYRRDLFDSVSFFEGKIHEDEFIIHSLVSKCKKISCINMRLYYYVQRNDSITSSVYTIKRMNDTIDGLLLRTKYFVEKGYGILAERTLRECIGKFKESYELLDLSDLATKNEYNKNKHEFKKIYKTIKNKNNKSILVMRINLFCINDKMYFILDDFFNHIRGKD